MIEILHINLILISYAIKIYRQNMVILRHDRNILRDKLIRLKYKI